MTKRRNQEDKLTIPQHEEFVRGCIAFRDNEKRDAMYKMATFIVDHFWGNHLKMAEGLGGLILTWNHAFYRYGSFSYSNLESCIEKNWLEISKFRNKNILYSEPDLEDVKSLFVNFNEALQIAEGKKKGTKSPVATAKTLHLLAPTFFPLWDDKIARAYTCHYSKNPAEAYQRFCKQMRFMAEKVSEYNNQPADVSILKLIDEYNYAKYTKKWIK